MSVREYVCHNGHPVEILGTDVAKINGKATENNQVMFSSPSVTTTPKVQMDRVATRLTIVESDSEVAIAQNTVEDFSVVFSQWQRVAIRGTDPRANQSEIDTQWSYNSSTDSIVGSINTATYVGFISQRAIPGDYSLEVEISSTNGDDDFIGIILGYVEVNGVCHTLSAIRTAGANGNYWLWALYLDFQGFTSGTHPHVILAGGNYDLIYPDGTLYPNRPAGSVGGWNTYKTMGTVKIKASLVGSVITVQTCNPGAAYSEASKIVFDLNSRDDTKQFLGGTRIGYSAMSQPACTWKSITRPGSRADYVDARTLTAWSYNGTQWVQASGSQLGNYLNPGRHYYNDLNRRIYYYEPVSSKLIRVATLSYTFATAQQVIDGVASNLVVSPASLRALYKSIYP